MARNQVRSGRLVEAKIVPAIGEVCRRQAVHWKRCRVFTIAVCRRRRPGIRSHRASASDNHRRGTAPRYRTAVRTRFAEPFLELHRVASHRLSLRPNASYVPDLCHAQAG